MDKAQIAAAGEALLSARAGHGRIDVDAQPAAPASLDEAYAIQTRVAAVTGAVGGWKVGAPSPDAQATFAPLPRADLRASSAELPGEEQRMRGVEVEVAYRLGQDLPARATPYTADEVAAAIDAIVPVIEIVETRLSNREAAGGLWALADNVSHDKLVLGDARRDWQDLQVLEVPVRLTFDDRVIVDRVCHNAGGHPFDMVVRLANLCGTHCGGLRAGQIVTTGSLMGLELAPPGARVHAELAGIGAVDVRFLP